MRIQTQKWLLAAALCMVGLSGCGGGGGGSSTAGTTVVNGTASKGIIYPGTVDVYAVNASGNKGARLASVQTAIDGTYTASLGAYSGAIQVEANGTYTDEATGREVAIPATAPLHAMVDAVDYTTRNNRVVSITPLTEVAWRKASNSGAVPTPPATMTSANRLVTDLFKVTDILSVEPVRPDTATMGSASTDAKVYTLVLATFSQMASTASGTTDIDKLETVLSRMATEVATAETSGSLSSSATTDFSTALNAHSLSSDFPTEANELTTVGRKSQSLTLSLSGTMPTGKTAYSIQGIIALPVNSTTGQLNTSLRSDSEGQTDSDVLVLTGSASGSLFANYEPLQQQMTFSVMLTPSGSGIGTGDFAVLEYDVASGATVSAADFSLVSGSVSIKDSTGADISGVTVTIK